MMAGLVLISSRAQSALGHPHHEAEMPAAAQLEARGPRPEALRQGALSRLARNSSQIFRALGNVGIAISLAERPKVN